jgi:hypothetical protein
MEISGRSDDSYPLYTKQQNKLAEIVGTAIALLTLIAPPLLVASTTQPLVINQPASPSLSQ